MGPTISDNSLQLILFSMHMHAHYAIAGDTFELNCEMADTIRYPLSVDVTLGPTCSKVKDKEAFVTSKIISA